MQRIIHPKRRGANALSVVEVMLQVALKFASVPATIARRVSAIWPGIVRSSRLLCSSEKYDCNFVVYPAVTIIHLRINALIAWRSITILVLSKALLQQKK